MLMQGAISIFEGGWCQVSRLSEPVTGPDSHQHADSVQCAALHVTAGQEYRHSGRHSSHGGSQLSDGLPGERPAQMLQNLCGTLPNQLEILPTGVPLSRNKFVTALPTTPYHRLLLVVRLTS